MATRGEQKVDEKKLQKAVESWVKAHRAKVKDQKLQSAVDDFVKQHRKEVGDRGMRIIRRVIAEGRTAPTPLTTARTTPTEAQARKAAGSTRTTNRRGPSKATAEKAIKTATDKAKDTLSKAGSRVGSLSKLGTGAGLLLVSEPLGGGVDAKDPSKSIKQTERGKKQVPAGGMGMPKPARGAERGRGDGASEVKARKAEAERKANADKPKTYKIKKGDTLSEIAQAKGTTVKALAEKNNIKDPDKIYAGRTLKLNKGGYANCGASMKPTQKSSKGAK